MNPNSFSSSIVILIIIGAVATFGLWGCPQYNVYRQRKDGEAQLAKANYSRQIAITEANAKFLSSNLLAASDTMRAHGIARSNEIIGSSLNRNPKYLHWLYLEVLKETKNQIIYLPTEAGVPILEANRTNPLNQVIEDSTLKIKKYE